MSPFEEDHWIEEDLTVEMNVTLRLSSPFKTINSGPYSAESLLLFAPTSETFNRYGALLTLHSKRLVMSSSSSSSSSSPSVFSSSLGSSTTEPLLVGAIQTLPPFGECCPEGRSGRCCRPVGFP